MPSTYDVGDQVRITSTFTDVDGAVGDPTSVQFLYDSPTSTAATSGFGCLRLQGW